MLDDPRQEASRGAAVIFIFVTILLDTLALGIIIPILPKLIESFVDNDTANAARIFGLFGTAWALMQFFFSPILGALSDRFGRRPVVLLSNFGLSLDYVLMALAPSLIWLFLGRVISGITTASISTAYAYIADITAPEKRAEVFGKIGVAFGAGFILGPALGGLLGDIDPRLPFWVAAGLSFANALYGWLILPESLPPERRSPWRWKSANPVGAVHLLRTDRVLAGLSIANFFAQLAHVVLPACSCCTRRIAMAGARQWSVPRLPWSASARWWCRARRSDRSSRRLGERRALLLGFGCGAIGFFIFAAAPTGLLSWVGIPFMALWGLAGASTQALMTRLVTPEQQGQLQGATMSVQSVSQLLGPFLFTLTFAYFIGAEAPFKLPGAPFFWRRRCCCWRLRFRRGPWRLRAPARPRSPQRHLPIQGSSPIVRRLKLPRGSARMQYRLRRGEEMPQKFGDGGGCLSSRLGLASESVRFRIRALKATAARSESSNSTSSSNSLRPGDVACDIGAATRAASSIGCPAGQRDGRVIAFEPTAGAWRPAWLTSAGQ